jgi:coenzyme F420-0:L-glutamate ligase/coenzyme F420-1:gamma-L-glutamate ligase
VTELVEVRPIHGLPEVRPGDDLSAMLADALRPMGVRAGDVVVVTQKVVSKAEGRLVPDEGDGRARWIERETAEVVARRGDLIVARTRYGFVCANAGVDASNVAPGFLTLLPDDPDASAEHLRDGLSSRLGAAPAVVITDTFGRPWRNGVVNVAIGCAGLPALVDLRGTDDHHGRVLEATVVALADEVAAASGLVVAKDARVAAALVRGVAASGPSGRARDLVRPAEDDLFRASPLEAISGRRDAEGFAPGDVPLEAIEAAVGAACAAPAAVGARLAFTALVSAAARRRLLSATSAGGADENVLRSAAVLVVPWLAADDVPGIAQPVRAASGRDAGLVRAGAIVERLLLALHAQGYGSAWVASPDVDTRAALEMDDRWRPVGIVAAGRIRPGAARPRPPADLSDVLRVR